jgi:hypothetical protein
MFHFPRQEPYRFHCRAVVEGRDRKFPSQKDISVPPVDSSLSSHCPHGLCVSGRAAKPDEPAPSAAVVVVVDAEPLETRRASGQSASTRPRPLEVKEWPVRRHSGWADVAGHSQQYAPGWVGSLVFFSPLSSSSPLLSRPLSLSLLLFCLFPSLTLSSSLFPLSPFSSRSPLFSFYPLASAFTFRAFTPFQTPFLQCASGNRLARAMRACNSREREAEQVWESG